MTNSLNSSCSTHCSSGGTNNLFQFLGSKCQFAFVQINILDYEDKTLSNETFLQPSLDSFIINFSLMGSPTISTRYYIPKSSFKIRRFSHK